MKIWFKRIVVGLLLVLLLALAGAAIFVLTFNPNEYKYKLEELVSARYQRTLAIQGDILFALFPRIAVAVSEVSLSERDSNEVFASVEAARFSIALWPLLFNRLLVDHVAIDGLRARVQRDAAGAFNFDDLLQSASAAAASPDADLLAGFIPAAQAGVPPQSRSVVVAQGGEALQPGKVPAANEAGMAASNDVGLPGVSLAVEGVPGEAALQIDIAGIELKDSEIFYEDAVAGYSQRLQIAQLLTGRMTFDQAFDVAFKGQLKGYSPLADLALDGQGQLFLDPRNKVWAAQKVAVRAAGNWHEVQAKSASLRGSFMVDGQARTMLAEAFDFSLKGSKGGQTPLDKLELDLAVNRFKLGYEQRVFELDKLVFRGGAEVAGQAVDLALDAPRLAVATDSAGGEPVSATLKLAGDKQLGVSLRASGLGGTANKLQLKQFKLEGRYKEEDQLVQLDASTPIEYIAPDGRSVLTALKGEVSTENPSQPESGFQFPLIGTAMVDWYKGKAEADLNAVLSGGPLNFKVSSQFAEAGKPPKLAFKLTADTIRLDQLLPVRAVRPGEVVADQAKNSQEPDEVSDTVSQPSADQAPASQRASRPALPILHALDLTGDIQIGSLFYDELLLQNVKAGLQAADGKLTLGGLTADAYEGKLKADLSLDSHWTLGARGSLAKVSMGPLLQAATTKERLSGRGTLTVDVRTQGPDAATLAQQLGGNITLRVTEGAIHGLDLEHLLAGMARLLPSISGGASPVVSRLPDLDEKTAFSLLDTHLQFVAGQGTFKKLVLDSPVFQVRPGKPATVDLVSQRLDLLTQLKVLSVPKAEHLAVLVAFRGLTVPLLIAGPLDAPSLTLQWQAVGPRLLQNAARSSISKLLDKSALPLVPVPTEETPPVAGEKQPQAPTVPAPADKLKELGKSLKGLLK